MSTTDTRDTKNTKPPHRRWDKMGVELEGSWIKRPRDIAAMVTGAQAKHDGSVRVGSGHDSEITTRPHTSLDGLCADVLVLYPDDVNDSCGFHIHTSFTPYDATILADPKFFTYFKLRWNKWGKENDIPRTSDFWARLRGDNRYCMNKFDPAGQLTPGHSRDNRYTMLNFMAWEKYKTIECRLLPMFREKEIAVKAIRELSDIYDTYLNEHEFPAVRMETEIEIDGDTVITSFEVSMPRVEPLEREVEVPYPKLPAGEDIYYAIPGAEDLMLPFGGQNLVSE